MTYAYTQSILIAPAIARKQNIHMTSGPPAPLNSKPNPFISTLPLFISRTITKQSAASAANGNPTVAANCRCASSAIQLW